MDAIQATLSELHRQTRKVVRPVIHKGQEVILTDFGRPVARIVPYIPTETVSPEEARMGTLTNQAILDAIRETLEDQAEHQSSLA